MRKEKDKKGKESNSYNNNYKANPIGCLAMSSRIPILRTLHQLMGWQCFCTTNMRRMDHWLLEWLPWLSSHKGPSKFNGKWNAKESLFWWSNCWNLRICAFWWEERGEEEKGRKEFWHFRLTSSGFSSSHREFIEISFAMEGDSWALLAFPFWKGKLAPF